MLITSRSGNWSIPKGLIDPGRTAREMAAIEALEEAGVIGEVGPKSIGTFTYEKWGATCRVEVYPMLVDRVLDKWLEDEFRERVWLPSDEAADTVARDEVAGIIRAFAREYASRA
ncbi:MAG: NUDIX hydrolase [Phycisphaerales bacterium]|nr:NUDIX hydrolase [Phycisphaerales bacterium]